MPVCRCLPGPPEGHHQLPLDSIDILLALLVTPLLRISDSAGRYCFTPDARPTKGANEGPMKGLAQLPLPCPVPCASERCCRGSVRVR